MDPTDELATMISYYHLYTSSSATDRSSTRANSGTEANNNNNNTQESNNNHKDKDYVFWVEDTSWTDEDDKRAESLLKSNQELCDIQSNPASRRNYLTKKYTTHSPQSWDRFYSTHQTNFFHDRHYLKHAFPNEFYGNDGVCNEGKQRVVVAEIGCGVGNAILPLLEESDTYEVWGFDFSKEAVHLLKQDARYTQAQQQNRAHAFVWDITKPLPADMIRPKANVCTVLFCLSAVMPHDMLRAVRHVVNGTLRPGGILVFRDYGRYDQAQLQLAKSRNKRLGDNLYVKHDGTRCYYFDVEDCKRLFRDGAGLQVLELRYIRRIYKNRETNQTRRRVWVQGRFQKPAG